MTRSETVRACERYCAGYGDMCSRGGVDCPLIASTSCVFARMGNDRLAECYELIRARCEGDMALRLAAAKVGKKGAARK